MELEEMMIKLTSSCAWWECKPFYAASGAVPEYTVVLREFDQTFSAVGIFIKATPSEAVAAALQHLADQAPVVKKSKFAKTAAPAKAPSKFRRSL